MDSSTLAEPLDDSDATRRRIRGWDVAAAVGPAVAVAVCLWWMLLTPLVGPPTVTPALNLMVAAGAAASVVAAWRARVPHPLVLLGATTGAAVAVPTVAGLVHRYPETLATPAAMGLATFAVAAAAPALTPRVVRGSVLVVLGAIVWLSLAMGAWALVSGETAALYQRGGREWIGVLQLSGVAGHPNGMALFAALALLLQVLSIPSMWAQPALRRVVLLLVGPVASGVALVWTQSRTGLLAVALVAGLMVVLRLLHARPVATAGLLTLAALSSVVPPLLTLLGVDISFHGRWSAWQVAWVSVRDNWPLGPGPATFSPAFWDFLTVVAPVWWEPAHAHNQVLQSLVMLGVVGLVVLAAAVGVMIWFATRVGYRDGGWAIAVCAALFVNAGPETVLGVADVVATYLPVLITVAVLASSWVLVGPTGSGNGSPDRGSGHHSRSTASTR